MTTIGDLIKSLESNQILQTVASGGIMVWLITNIKGIFSFIVSSLTNLISFTVYNTYTDERGFGHSLYDRQIAFDEIVSKSKSLWERTANLDLSSGASSEGWEDEDKMEFVDNYDEATDGDVSPQVKTYGFSIRILQGSLVFVNRTINKNQKITVDTSIRVFFARKKKFLQRLNSRIEATVMENLRKSDAGNKVKVFYGSNVYNCYIRKNKRSLDSIFLDGDGHKELLEDIRKFISNRKIYQSMNYPYKYSALIHGVPGSGKTSTILAIATELNRDVEYLNISGISATDLMDRLNKNPNRIFVFEDIDAISFSANSTRTKKEMDGNEREKKDDGDDTDVQQEDSVEKNLFGTLNLSDLLNITDGLLSSDGTICIFTTNHRERLDPAFLRAGRMNKTVEFRYLGGETAAKMVKYHLGADLSGMKDGIKPAELQEAILDVKVGKKTLEDLKREFCEEGNS